jgi:hypothetical protein
MTVNTMPLIVAAASNICSNTAFAAVIHDASGPRGICVGMDTSKVSANHKSVLLQVREQPSLSKMDQSDGSNIGAHDVLYITHAQEAASSNLTTHSADERMLARCLNLAKRKSRLSSVVAVWHNFGLAPIAVAVVSRRSSSCLRFSSS